MDTEVKVKRKYTRKPKIVVEEPVLEQVKEPVPVQEPIQDKVILNKELVEKIAIDKEKKEKLRLEKEQKEELKRIERIEKERVEKEEMERLEKERVEKELIEKEEMERQLEIKREEIIRSSFLGGYKTTAVYIYYEGNSIDTIQYIKDFQDTLNSYKLGSQVVICCVKNYSSLGIRNCFHTETAPKKWTDICMSREPICCLRIKERPNIKPTELFELLKEKTEYTDAFVEIIEY